MCRELEAVFLNIAMFIFVFHIFLDIDLFLYSFKRYEYVLVICFCYRCSLQGQKMSHGVKGQEMGCKCLGLANATVS